MSVVILCVPIRATEPEGATATRGALSFAPGALYVEPADHVEEGGGWRTIYPDGRLANPAAWLFARCMVEVGGEEAWALVLPAAPALDDEAARAAWDAVVVHYVAQARTLAELREDPSPTAAAIRAAWPDERPRLSHREGEGEATRVVDDGPDPAYERVAIYRGIGRFTRAV